jgi:hypothetical protein
VEIRNGDERQKNGKQNGDPAPAKDFPGDPNPTRTENFPRTPKTHIAIDSQDNPEIKEIVSGMQDKNDAEDGTCKSPRAERRGGRSADKAATKGILQKETKQTKKKKILPRMRNSRGQH